MLVPQRKILPMTNPQVLSQYGRLGRFDPYERHTYMSDNPMSVGGSGEALPLSRKSVTKNKLFLAPLYKYTSQPVTLYT